VAPQGGSSRCTNGCGLVYTLTPTANLAVWQKQVIFGSRGGMTGTKPAGQLPAGRPPSEAASLASRIYLAMQDLRKSFIAGPLRPCCLA
jgi:hypothetical protein